MLNVLLLMTVLGPLPAGEEPAGPALEGLEELVPGETVVTTLSPGTESIHALPAGAMTIAVESVDFDPMAVVLGPDGAVLASDADSGSLWGAWLSVDEERPEGCRLVVRIQNQGAGRCLLTARSGRHPAPVESEAAALSRVYAVLADHEEQQGNLDRAQHDMLLLGNNLFQRNELVLARRALERALELGLAMGDVHKVALTRAFLGAIERRIGSDEEAVVLLELARPDIDSGRPDLLAFVLENLGQALFDLRDYEASLAVNEECLAVATRSGLKGSEALAWSRLGTVHMLMGDDAGAREHHGEALKRLPDLPDRDLYVAPQVLLAVAQFHSRAGRYADAEPLLRKAMELDPNAEGQLALNLELGKVCLALGRFGEARRCLDLVELQLAGREDARFTHVMLNTLATLEFGLGDIAEARELTEEALLLAEQAGDLEGQARELANLGMYAEREGDPGVASNLYERAEALWNATDAPHRGWSVHLSRGRLALDQGRRAEALEHNRRALDLAREDGSVEGEAAALNGLAWTLLALDQPAGAREHAVSALELLEEVGEPAHMQRTLHTLACVELAEGRLDAVDALLAQADLLLEGEAITSLDPQAAAGARSWFFGWSEVAQDLVAARLEEPDADRAALLAWGLDQAGRWKGRALLEQMPSPAVSLSGLAPLAAALGPDRALVEYARGADDLYAYILDADGLERVDLGPLEGLEAGIAGYVGGMSDLARLAPPADIAREGSRLHQRVLAPVLARLDAGVDDLVIVPSAELARLPFEALVSEVRNGGRTFDDMTFVGDDHALTYGPSTPVLARLVALGPRREPGRVLVMGDPLYGAETDPQAGWNRLPATRGEAVAVVEALLLQRPEDDTVAQAALASLPRLRRERSEALESARFDLYLGAEVTSDRLRGDLREYGVIHIAAHGMVDAEDPRRSGLVLSWNGRAHDYVYLEDIQELELDADMVVLSACDTASGRVLEGEGVQSLARAFLQAGSRSVMASLWNVDDEATRETMTSFYDALLLEGRDQAEALRDAKSLRDIKQRIRSSRGESLAGDPLVGPGYDPGHPYFWAPFIYVGAVPRDGG